MFLADAMRAELEPAERAAHLRRRKEIFEQRRDAERTSNSGQIFPTIQIGPGRPKSFAAATAAATGISKREINQAIRRAERIVPEALAAVAGTSLDKGGPPRVAKVLPPVCEQLHKSGDGSAVSAVTGELPSPRKPLKTNVG